MKAALFLALALFATPALAAKKPIDFSSFRGNYAGTVTLTFANTVFTGTANVQVLVPKNGQSVTATMSGVLFAGGDSNPYTNSFTFTRGGGYFSPNILLVEGLGIPESGTYQAHKRNLSYTAQFVAGESTGPVFGSLSVRPAGGRQNLVLTNIVQVNGQANIFTTTFQVSRKLKKSER